MISKELVELVHTEATKLKENMTRSEREQLSPKRFYAWSPEKCIYGMATGHCRSKRASDLITQCAPKILFSNDDFLSCSLTFGTDSDLKAEPKHAPNTWEYFSPIESYIMEDDADTEQLIGYLKGDLQTLNLNKTVNC